MSYLGKVASLCEKFSPVSTCLCPKYIKFCFQNLRIGRKDKNECRKTTFCLDEENKFVDIFC